MKTTREVKMSVLRNWLENETEINEEYNALEKALEELDNIYHSDNEDDTEVEVGSKELTSRGYKVLSRNGIRKTGIDTLLEEYKEELRQQIITMDLYHSVEYGSQDVVSDEVVEEIHCASAITIDEFRKCDLRLRVSHGYELILNKEHRDKLSEMNEEEKYQYIVENGEYML